MKALRFFALMLSLAVWGCTGGTDSGQTNTNTNTGTDNQVDGSTPTNDPTAADPIATFTVKKLALKAAFDASAVTSPGYTAADILVRWDYTNDGTFDTDWTTKKTTTYTYPADGDYTVALQIKDPENRTDSATKLFTIKAVNTAPTAVMVVNLVKGMTATVDASSSSDGEDLPNDLLVRWDWNGDNIFDTDWTTVKTAEHVYDTAGEYTIKLQVKDLNDAIKTATQAIVASPITIRNSFITYGSPYMIQFHFRVINNLTGEPVTPADDPALTRGFFTISEDNVPIDLSETNQLLYHGKRPMFMVLVLDFTGSMYDSGGVIPMLDAAKAFIESQGDNNYISVWGFWERQGGNAEIDDFTRCDAAGKAKLQTDLDAFSSVYHDRGATEIWDLLAKVVANKFPDTDTGVNRGIVFLSDGHDTTSLTNINTLIDATQKKAAFIFSVGIAFRPSEYPADEANLKKVAEQTGGLYFTVNQVSDLSTVFNQLSEDVTADWTLSYITLKSIGTPTVKAVCTYLDGYTSMTGKFPVTEQIKGDIKKGLLLAYPALDNPAGQTEYTLYAGYIPRNIATFRIKVTSPNPVRLTLYDSETICDPADGWAISPDVAAGDAPPSDGLYILTSNTPLEYGSWGRVAKCIVDGTNAPAAHFELPSLTDQAILYGDKTLVFYTTDTITLDVP